MALLLSGPALPARGAADEPSDLVVPAAKVGLSPSYGSVLALNDGRLLWAWGPGGRGGGTVYGTVSSDTAKTWSDPVPLMLDDGRPMHGQFTTSLVRLASGAIGLAMQTASGELSFFLSRNEGKTWSPGVRVHAENDKVAFTNDRALVLASGRIILPVYTALAGPKLPVRKPKVTRFGAQFDTVSSGMGYSYVIYSDDEGKTWKRSDNGVFVSLEKGTGGNFSAEEPAVAELGDGRLVMFVRTSLGRFYRSYSEDKGVTWLEAQPTPLLGPPAPCCLVRRPGTGDLLAIWTQVSAFEVMQGLYRHRLTCAVSHDGGVTWTNHRNFESLDDTTRIEDEIPQATLFGTARQPVDRKRYFRAPGPLRASYATCTFVGGKAIVTYGLSTLGDKETITGTYGMDYDEVVRQLGLGPEVRANKVRVIPIEWFGQK
ncbi:MAG: exo-alpha-sialidase [Opitutae bacterium]|nr:exo-alpha-sialidase [Opitutae bacterium]